MAWDLFGVVALSREVGLLGERIEAMEKTLKEGLEKMDTAWQTALDKVAAQSTKLDSVLTLLAELRKAPSLEEVHKLIDDLTANDAKLDKAIGPATTV